MFRTVDSNIFRSHRATGFGTGSYPGIAEYSAQKELCTDVKNGESGKHARDRMKVWGMLSEEDEEDGFGVFLDNDSYVVLLYYEDTIVALFDPNDYTLPELNDVVQKVIQAVRRNPLVICAGNILWARN